MSVTLALGPARPGMVMGPSLAGHTCFKVWRRARILAARVVGENTSCVLLFVCSAGMLAAPIRLQNY